MPDVLLVQPVGVPAFAEMPLHRYGPKHMNWKCQTQHQLDSLLSLPCLNHGPPEKSQTNSRHLLVLEKFGILKLLCIPQSHFPLCVMARA